MFITIRVPKLRITNLKSSLNLKTTELMYMENETHFHMHSFALRLVFIQRETVTWKIDNI